MNGHGNRWVGIVLAVLFAVGIGAAAYQAGVTHGLALQIPAGAAAPVPPYYYYGWYRPWGFGIGPFLFLLFAFAILRCVLWGGRRRWYYYRHWDDLPPHFEDWHRRAHDRMKGGSSSQSTV